MNDEKNGKLYADYKEMADEEEKVIFGGRLGEYKYFDMDTTVASVLEKRKRRVKVMEDYSVKVIVAAHKPYEMPFDKMYLPVHVGAAGKDSIGYQRDDEGDNVSKT